MTQKQFDHIKRIAAYAVQEGMPQRTSEIMAYHAFVETSGFKSELFLEANNAFSYRYKPGNYLQLDDPYAIAYASYGSVRTSVKEICNLIKLLAHEGEFPLFMFVNTADAYIHLMEPKLGLSARCNDFLKRMEAAKEAFEMKR